jgi:hypothetical protein
MRARPTPTKPGSKNVLLKVSEIREQCRVRGPACVRLEIAPPRVSPSLPFHLSSSAARHAMCGDLHVVPAWCKSLARFHSHDAVGIQVPGAEGDILLDFTQLSGDGGPVARRDALLAAILAQLSTGAHAGGCSGLSGEVKLQAAAQAQPQVPPTKPKAPSRPSETAAPAASKPVEGAAKGRHGGAEAEQQRALKLMTNKRWVFARAHTTQS